MTSAPQHRSGFELGALSGGDASSRLTERASHRTARRFSGYANPLILTGAFPTRDSGLATVAIWAAVEHLGRISSAIQARVPADLAEASAEKGRLTTRSS
jgi:hypothetical protein